MNASSRGHSSFLHMFVILSCFGTPERMANLAEQLDKETRHYQLATTRYFEIIATVIGRRT